MKNKCLTILTSLLIALFAIFPSTTWSASLIGHNPSITKSAEFVHEKQSNLYAIFPQDNSFEVSSTTDNITFFPQGIPFIWVTKYNLTLYRQTVRFSPSLYIPNFKWRLATLIYPHHFFL
ncbi:hypothetical protein ACG2LH_03620 [Zhouia sp. PK063]|uniref:hypothetical protein n=1 Tax=Zhouia sp. PK063 TaxID=3373602 RepID=UPI00378E679D